MIPSVPRHGHLEWLVSALFIAHVLMSSGASLPRFPGTNSHAGVPHLVAMENLGSSSRVNGASVPLQLFGLLAPQLLQNLPSSGWGASQT